MRSSEERRFVSWQSQNRQQRSDGEQFAMIPGMPMTLTWFGNSLAPQSWLPKPTMSPAMARELALLGWMTWPVREASHISTIADIVDGARINCTHSGDSNVDCRYGSSNLRLAKGGYHFGRVEVYHNMEHGAESAITARISVMPV